MSFPWKMFWGNKRAFKYIVTDTKEQRKLHFILKKEENEMLKESSKKTEMRKQNKTAMDKD